MIVKHALMIAGGAAMLMLAIGNSSMAKETMFAIVSHDCVLIDGMRATRSEEYQKGVCKVFFDRPVRKNCAYFATLSSDRHDWPNVSGTVYSAISTWPDSSDNRQIWVASRDIQGTLKKTPFHLLVVCKK